MILSEAQEFPFFLLFSFNHHDLYPLVCYPILHSFFNLIGQNYISCIFFLTLCTGFCKKEANWACFVDWTMINLVWNKNLEGRQAEGSLKMRKSSEKTKEEMIQSWIWEILTWRIRDDQALN
jgi:hypothetical protein